MGKTQIGPDLLAQVLASDAVTQAVQQAGARRLAKAKLLAYQGGRQHLGDELRLVVGVRPGAKAVGGMRRPFARLEATLTPEQQAADNRTAKLSRKQILRRSAR